jgi:RNA polymerase sigma factor (sigma-70 family)
MNEHQLRTVVGTLRRAISANPTSRISDARLVERFLSRRDELAFEMLVWRHGAMVLNVCRRVLGDAHEAEDAFQATFLVFARKVGSIGKREAVGSWLYKVGYRVALRARQRTALRRPELRPDWEEVPSGVAGDDPAQQALWNDLRPVLDEEVSRLPDKYRKPFVLFYLEGMAYPEVAEELGCPKGTVSSRLTTAKGLLRQRLARRGVALSGMALGTALTRAAAGAVTIGLTNATTETMRLIAGGQAAGAGAGPAKAVALAEGVMRAMMLTKMRIAAALVLAVGLLGFGASVVVQQSVRGAQPAPGDRPADPAKAPPGIAVGQPTPGNFKAPPAGPERGRLVKDPALGDFDKGPYLLLPDKPDARPDDAMTARLAKIEDRLTKLEAQVARLQAKAPGPDHENQYERTTGNPFGRNSGWSRPADYGYGKFGGGDKLLTIDTKSFQLPIAISEKEQAAIEKVELYMSADEGRSWKVAGTLAGDQRAFPVSVPHDGVFWFKVHAVYKSGPNPKPDWESVTPDLKVRVVSKQDDTDVQLKVLETQLRELQDRIAELKAKKGEAPKKP